MNQTLKNIKEGKLAIFHDTKGISEKLSKILKEVFPDDNKIVNGSWNYYYKDIHYPKTWSYSDCKPSYMNSMTTDEVYQQLFSEKKLKGYKLNGKVSKEKIANLLTCATATKDSLFFWEGHLKGGYPPFDKAKELGILDLWFEPVYEEDKPAFFTYKISNGKEVTVFKEGVCYEGKVLSVEGLKSLLNEYRLLHNFRLLPKSWELGCLEFTRKNVEDILSLNKEL